ncbi:MAG TPA: flagellar hook capping FlgD N-terminal domain-containing protein [Spirochaetota bacterium]|nr:flagellar hook capping FlgD N-terminal domain-containing protein [Spirochaetota bacterium]HPJ33962.1 flagellar hook capping FlgD N-terminal domain-containing protein [Spirochaetota bacterium]
MKVFEMSAQDRMSAAIQATESNKKNKTGEAGVKNNLGKESFLKLLVTELRHQDPTKPMEDKEFIAQMAQFSTLEQMSNMNKEIKNLLGSSRAYEAYGILGKEVDTFDTVKKVRVSGVVSSVFYKGDEVMLRIGAEEVPMKNIHSVSIAQGNNKSVPETANFDSNKAGYENQNRQKINSETVNVIQ